jgi:hypothetical protein
MAAITYSFTQPIGLDPYGAPIVECRYFVTDPQIPYSAKALSAVVVLNPADPFSWDSAIENAIIADAAAQQPTPFIVSAARCLTPVYSESLLKDTIAYAAPVEGFAISIGNSVEGILLNPAGPLGAGTLTLPGNPQNGRVVKIASSQAVISLTLSLGSGQLFAVGAAVTTLAANEAIAYIWRGQQNTWFRWI